MSELTLIVMGAALLAASALFAAALYDAVVLAPNLRGGPAGLEHGRLFMIVATPAKLFRVLSPATQILVLVAAVSNWPSPQRRIPLIGALLALVLSDVITFAYHYPRNHLLFDAPLTVEPEKLRAAARQWAAANLVRVALVLGSWVATLIALLNIASAWPAAPKP